MTRDALLALSKEDLVAVILAQQARIEGLAVQVGALTAQVAALRARLNVPPKTPDNSSTVIEMPRAANISSTMRKLT